MRGCGFEERNTHSEECESGECVVAGNKPVVQRHRLGARAQAPFGTLLGKLIRVGGACFRNPPPRFDASETRLLSHRCCSRAHTRSRSLS
jgi:hypothetical protein